ncbi:SDR family NAD(P)-dependent oxidoreductase [Anaerocolumna sp. AGMB13020]|uniref:SDR family NAD(P)-dependent oxidoreductase n=1 Tax=Anaerocolumna sp. AGMB13020 TaxID=3081750 RepID=UPI00295340EA|nr:SDR family NAD(P)-dependent oxidoreductase [Anaerocolumna sp. AGMB13020]WOO37929.1 SDR family NAD(P)-dependent oxidoreductase [Anaerocolumna sp. AGMB13020]
MSGSSRKEDRPSGSVHRAEDNKNSSAGYMLNYYEEQWSEKKPEKSLENNKAVGTEIILIFGVKELQVSIDSNIADRDHIVTVYEGGRYQSLSGKEYEVNPHNQEDYRKLLKDIKEKGLKIKNLLYFWALKSEGVDQAVLQKLIKGEKSAFDIETSCMSEEVEYLFLVLTSIIQAGMTHFSKMLVFTHKDERQTNPFHEIIANYGKSTGFLLPEIGFSTIHISDVQKINDVINDELSCSYSEPEVFYTKGKRYIKTYHKLTAPFFEKADIRPGSVFLITGGAGKLGMLFAKYLTEEYKVNLVLVGRSDLDDKKKAMLEELKETGSQVLYQKADVTSKSQMQKVIHETKKKFGALSGVIHAAGLVSDKLISQKGYEEFHTIIQVKMLGTIVLDELTKNEPLDYFFLFSSTSSIIGDFGQCDYSIGNRFLDCYQEHRRSLKENGLRSGKTITINWPLWENGGMHQDKDAENLYLQTAGLSYLKDSDGLRAFKEILALNRGQAIVFCGYPHKVDQILRFSEGTHLKANLNAHKQSEQNHEAIFPQGTQNRKDETLEHSLEADIRTIAADILKVKVKDIESNLNFGDFGFDSISLKILVKRLGEKYNLALSPTILFSASTIKGLADYILNNFFEAVDRYYERTGTKEGLKEATGYKNEIAETEPSKTLNSKVRTGTVPTEETNRKATNRKEASRKDTEREELNKEELNKEELNKEQLNKEEAEREVRFSHKRYLTPFKNHTQELAVKYRRDNQEQMPYEPIAIIGAEGIFPGSNDLNDFWDNLKEGRDLITEIPPDRWDWKEYYSEDRLAKNKATSKCGGFIKEVDKFDAPFFNISPMEAELMDPQQRLLLQTVWKVTEDAGYKASELSGKSVGVYIGVQFNDYQELLQESDEMKPQIVTGNSHAVLANRISYFMNFKGPSEAIDTACSGSLVAIHHAVKSLQRGESEMAVAGGVSLMLSPKTFLSASKLGVLSPDNHCKTFDESANGYVRGEGIGVILLKPLKQAIKDRDNIYAVIRGSAQNHGGRANSLTAPNSDSQAEVLMAAYRDAGIDPASVTYIEAHGTGTELGDPVEIEGLKKAFRELGKKYKKTINGPNCGLGSVKTNIGHLEPAAGIAGIIKVILAMRYHTLPASINFHKLNPYINFENSPFYIVSETKEWLPLEDLQGNRIPRRGGVSSFGFGGANAHVVLEEYKKEELQKAAEEAQIIILSARSEGNLKQYATDLLKAVNTYGNDSLCLANISFTLQTGREEMNERLAFVANNLEELRNSLNQYIRGERSKDLLSSNTKKTRENYELLARDEDAAVMVEQWISKRKLIQLAKLWVTGYEINWKLLHNPNTVQRISLPTYPFTKESHWLPITSMKTTNKELAALIDRAEYLRSFDGEIIFSKELKLQEAIVRDHIINGQNIFPGVGYMEMAYQAASIIFNSRDIEICKLFWLSPLILNKSAVKIVISLKKEEEKLIFEIKEAVNGSNALVYVKGELHKKAEESDSDQFISLEAIKQRCSQRIKGEELYRHYENDGISYGAYFKGIKEVYLNDREVLGIIQIPDNSGPDLKTYTLHPALLDSALQTISCIAGAEGKINLPFAVERFEIRKPLKPVMYTYVRAAGNNSYEISLISETGEICARFHKYVLKEIRSKAPDIFYQPVWRKSSVSRDTQKKIGDEVLAAHETAVIIYTKEGKPVADRIAEKHGKAIRVLLGEKNNKIAEDYWEVKYDASEALGEIIKKINERKLIYFLGGIQLKPLKADDLEAVRESQEKGVISLFRLIKALESSKYSKQTVDLKILTNNIYPVNNSPVILPAASSIHGFVKSLAKEYTKYRITTIDIDLLTSRETDKKEVLSEINANPDKLTSENLTVNSLTEENLATVLLPIFSEAFNPNGETVVFREGERYERRIEPLQIPLVTQSVLKEKGVYVILGGAGGIGLILSRYLSKTVKAKLFLIGRSVLSENGKNTIREIESLGGTVHYYQADITDKESLEAAIREVKAVCGNRINGVFHSAMVSADKLIYKMTEEDFKTAFSPKVYGSVALYSVFQKEALDFMAFFSSTSSQIGMPGQSNYVSGLNFKDNFASYIQKKLPYPVKIFNWGYWGIGSGEQTEFRERMKKTGIQAIEPIEGMEIVERVLSANEKQVFILKAENKVLKQMGITSDKAHAGAAIASRQVFQSEIRNSAGNGEGTEISLQNKLKAGEYPAEEELLTVKEFLRDYLSTIIANNLKCEKEGIENRTSFQEYGIDSILGFQIYGDLEESFGDIPTTLFLDNDNIDELVVFFLQNKEDRVHQLYYQCNNSQSDNSQSNSSQCNNSQSNERQSSGMRNNKSQDNSWTNTTQGNTESVKKVNQEIVKSKLNDFLQETIAEILKCNKASIEPQLSFEEFGIDSILGFQLLAALEASFEDLPATLFLDNTNVEELAEFLLLNYSQKVKSMFWEDSYESESQALTGRSKVREAEVGSRKSTTETEYIDSRELTAETDEMYGRMLTAETDEMYGRIQTAETDDVYSRELTAETDDIYGRELTAETEDMYGRELTVETDDINSRELTAETDEMYGRIQTAETDDIYGRELTVETDEMYGRIQTAETDDTYSRELKAETNDIYGRELTAETDDIYGRELTAETDDIYGEKPRTESQETITEKKLTQPVGIKELRFSDLVKEKSKDIKLPIDLESFLVEVEDNTKIEVSIKGKGEPILIIPGLAVTTVISSYQFIELSSKYQVIGINLPGHGRSDGIDDLSFKGISEILIKVLEKLEIRQQLHVVGGSYGGIIAQNIALKYPARVKTLTLIGSITATKFEGVAQVFSFTEAVSKDFEAVKQNAISSDVIQNIDYYFDLYKHSQSTNSPVLLKYLELMKIKMTTREVLEQITVPTLVIVGAVDTVVETEESRLIHSKVRDSQYIEIADGGHFIHLTHHELVSNAILVFLEKYK